MNYLPHTNALRYRDKVSVFYDTTVDLLEKGNSPEMLNEVAELMEQDELWEAADGMRAALNELSDLKEGGAQG